MGKIRLGISTCLRESIPVRMEGTSWTFFSPIRWDNRGSVFLYVLEWNAVSLFLKVLLKTIDITEWPEKRLLTG